MTKFFVDGLERVLSTFFEVLIAGALFGSVLVFEAGVEEWLEFMTIPFAFAVLSALVALVKVNAARVLFDPTSASLVDPRDITVDPLCASTEDASPPSGCSDAA